MGIARIYNRVLHRELACRAAWPPIANTIALGDYGVIGGGVFVPLGNISRDFGVPIEVGPDSPAAKLDFVSDSTTIVRVAGGGDVPVFPDTPIEARLTFAFEGAQSLVLKSNEVVTRTLANAGAAARALAKHKAWRLRYRVVRQVWHAAHALVLTTREAKTNVTFAADAAVLRQLDIGNVGVDIDVGSDKAVGLELVGRAGVVGLGLFRVRIGGGVAVRGTVREGEVDQDDDGVADLDDDV